MQDKDPNNPVKEYTGVWIPREVMECEELTATEKIAYGEIACFNVCYASNAWLAKRIGRSEWTARQSISKLKALGFIEEAGYNGRFRQIRVLKNPQCRKTHNQTVEKSPGRLLKNPQSDCRKITTIDKSKEQSIEQSKIVATESRDERAIQLANRLYKWVMRNKPNRKVQAGWEERWAREIELMHRIDGRSWEAIAQAIDWSQQDSFWWCNIVSGKKLREKFDTIESQYSRERKGNASEELWARINAMTPQQLQEMERRQNGQ